MLEKHTDKAIAAALGPRLKAARSTAGLTLKALSAASGLSQPFLSRLERGQVSASIANLLQLCRVLGLSVGDLLASAAASPAPAWNIFRANGGGAPVAADGYSFRLIAPTLRGRRMDSFLLDFPRDGGMEFMVAHEGEELLLVLDGRIRFRFGDEAAILEPGDAVQFDSSLPHSAANIGIRPARALMVTAPARGAPFGSQGLLVEAAKSAPRSRLQAIQDVKRRERR